MAGKIFSSRDDLPIEEALTDFVALAHALLKEKEAPATDTASLLLQLDAALAHLAEVHMALKRDMHTLSLDALALTMNNAKLSHDLRITMRFLEALAMPPNGPAFDKALVTMKREGDPEISTSALNPDDPHEIEVDVKLIFTEESLAEALRVAIIEYNYETVASMN